jgi:hypothetical protein
MPRFALSHAARLQVTAWLHGVSIGADRMESTASKHYRVLQSLPSDDGFVAYLIPFFFKFCYNILFFHVRSRTQATEFSF